eukprot:TRINITY_DN25686_c0_g2_i1.p1 TRINITY_DN25686_c0_g2~~TRINITY_DN25686_c0_g2_i1.p1  ORF type:complete len:808 (+),score=128.83 TRINITY_DN25686_c0_g2_i1:45-2468(+)
MLSSPSNLKETLHGEFLLNGQLRKYAFMSMDGAQSKFEVGRLMRVWKLDTPNLVVQLNGHNRTFQNLVTKEMVENLPGFGDLQKRIGDATLEEVNKHVINRVSNIFGAVAVALDMTGSWLLRKGIPLCNHLLMQHALEKSKASPVIVAVDNLDQYSEDWTGKIGKVLAEFNTELLDKAKPLKEKPGNPTPQITIDFADQVRIAPFAGGSESPNTPAENIKCQFTAPWTSATHYIFIPEASKFDPNIFGNAGYICVSGGWLNKAEDIRSAIQQGDPAVLIDNTGGETQQYARLVSKIKEYRATGLTSSMELQEKAQEILEHATLGTKNMPGDEMGMDHVTLPEVLRIIDLVCERPSYFDHTFLIVDALVDTTDQVIQKVSKSFSSRALHAMEMGAGSADQNLITEAWRLHRMLTASAAKLQTCSNLLVFLTAMFTFIGSVVAVLSLVFDDWQGFLQSVTGMSTVQVAELLDTLSIAAPALATVFAGLIVAFQNGAKAISLRTTATKVVAEIFKFRMRVGEYSISANVQPINEAMLENEEATAEQELNESVRLYRTRDLFQKNLRELAGNMGTGIVTEAAMEYSEFDEGRKQDMTTHVELSLYGKILDKKEKRDLDDGAEPLLDMDAFDAEHLSCMSCQTYVGSRVRPLLQLYMKERARISCFDTTWTVLLLILTTMATVLAAVNMHVWVPVLYALSAFLKTFQDYSCWSARQTAMATAISELMSLQSFWASLSTVDKGLPATRQRLVEVTETAVLTVFLAETGGKANVLDKTGATDASSKSAGSGGGAEKATKPEKDNSAASTSYAAV